MLDRESEEIAAQPNVQELSDPEELVKRELAEHPEILEAVEERKKRKLFHSGAYSIGGFIVGVGVIVVIVGICRFLIGLIKPIVPSQL